MQPAFSLLLPCQGTEVGFHPHWGEPVGWVGEGWEGRWVGEGSSYPAVMTEARRLHPWAGSSGCGGDGGAGGVGGIGEGGDGSRW